jgi:hypothetical protein
MFSTRLPIELTRMIYQMYFSWVLTELRNRQPQKNDFIVRTSRSSTPITEFHARYGILYLDHLQTSRYYRAGIPALPFDLELAFCSESSSPIGGGYVSPYIRDVRTQRI